MKHWGMKSQAVELNPAALHANAALAKIRLHNWVVAAAPATWQIRRRDHTTGLANASSIDVRTRFTSAQSRA